MEKELVLLQRDIWDLLGEGTGLGGGTYDPVKLLTVFSSVHGRMKSQLTPVPFQVGHQAQSEKKLQNPKRAESTPWQ